MSSQRWVITGGSRGIGLATAKAALSRGDRVAIMARRPDEPALRRELGADALLLAADVTEPPSIAEALSQVRTAWGGLDVLVNNAGLHRGRRLARLDTADWDAVLATNLSGPMHCIKAALGLMGDGGSVVNIGAVVGLRGFPGDSPYGASKAGLSGLTQVLAVELAPKNIRVNLVVPGLVMSEMTSEVDGKAMERLLARIPLGRVGRAEEIAEVICWVARSTYMTGAIIPTDGGLMAQF